MTKHTAADRLRAEFLEMPGLRLTVEQAQRLCGVERALCKAVLDSLVDSRFLSVKANGTYGRVSEGEDLPRPRPARVHAFLSAPRQQQRAS